jgi:hypothetical protein
VTSEGDGELGFVSIRAARALEFEAAVIGDVDLLVRVIDR